MSDQIDDGGPAFARPYGGHPDPAVGDPEMQSQEGMSLRDYFAAKALPAIVAVVSNGTHNPLHEGNIEDAMARDCYRLADAMLAARKVTR